MGRWKHDEHINVKEARVVLMGIRRSAKMWAAQRKKWLLFTDNLVTACMLEKGRSPSYSLNAICRRACAYQLACGSIARFRYLETERNPADEGSRRPIGPTGRPVAAPPRRIVQLADFLPETPELATGPRPRVLRLAELLPEPPAPLPGGGGFSYLSVQSLWRNCAGSVHRSSRWGP